MMFPRPSCRRRADALQGSMITPAVVAKALAVAFALQAVPASADEAAEAHWRFAVAPYALHFNRSPEHRRVWAIGLERQEANGNMLGASYFSNSFGQPSGYVYAGRQYTGLLGQPQLFAQVSFGLMYGYRGEFKHKVPLNMNGFSPGALLTLGTHLSRETSVSAHLLGTAGVMLQLSYALR